MDTREQISSWAWALPSLVPWKSDYWAGRAREETELTQLPAPACPSQPGKRAGRRGKQRGVSLSQEVTNPRKRTGWAQPCCRAPSPLSLPEISCLIPMLFPRSTSDRGLCPPLEISVVIPFIARMPSSLGLNLLSDGVFVSHQGLLFHYWCKSSQL